MVENCAVNDCHKREYLAEIERLRTYIQSLDGKTIAIRGEGNMFIDDGVIVASDILDS